ncbi:hypothetical protein [Roseobacter weihaiensis]|nr:hypothetical protein [Roseobacter sp. H9]
MTPPSGFGHRLGAIQMLTDLDPIGDFGAPDTLRFGGYRFTRITQTSN